MLFVPLPRRSEAFERKENVCCNFNDVYLMMPELMSQQTIMVSAASNFPYFHANDDDAWDE
jgi:hypothetical protein